MAQQQDEVKYLFLNGASIYNIVKYQSEHIFSSLIYELGFSLSDFGNNIKMSTDNIPYYLWTRLLFFS